MTLGLCPAKGQSPRVPGRRTPRYPPRRHRSGPLRSPPVGGPHLSTKSKHKGDVALAFDHFGQNFTFTFRGRAKVTKPSLRSRRRIADRVTAAGGINVTVQNYLWHLRSRLTG
jgi:hypothetical protein